MNSDEHNDSAYEWMFAALEKMFEVKSPEPEPILKQPSIPQPEKDVELDEVLDVSLDILDGGQQKENLENIREEQEAAASLEEAMVSLKTVCHVPPQQQTDDTRSQKPKPLLGLRRGGAERPLPYEDKPRPPEPLLVRSSTSDEAKILQRKMVYGKWYYKLRLATGDVWRLKEDVPEKALKAFMGEARDASKKKRKTSKRDYEADPPYVQPPSQKYLPKDLGQLDITGFLSSSGIGDLIYLRHFHTAILNRISREIRQIRQQEGAMAMDSKRRPQQLVSKQQSQKNSGQITAVDMDWMRAPTAPPPLKVKKVSAPPPPSITKSSDIVSIQEAAPSTSRLAPVRARGKNLRMEDAPTSTVTDGDG